jgi:hypothetical protein
MNKISSGTVSKKLFYLDVKMLIQALVYMPEAMTHITPFLTFLMEWLSLTMATKKQINM